MKLPPLVLASASPRRAEILRSLGFDFRVEPSRADEIHDERLELGVLCAANAELKAREVAARFPASLVIGADTMVGLRGRWFGKPDSLPAAAEMLRALSGQTHQVITAVALACSGRVETFRDLTQVTFRPLGEAVIAEYLATVPVLDKAGAYGIQERGDLLVARIEGSFSNVVGFPTEMFLERIAVFAPTAAA